MPAAAPYWLATAQRAAEAQDWPEAARIIEARAGDWPEEPAFLLQASRWLRMAGHGARANAALRRAAALENSFGAWQEAEILEIELALPAPPPHPAAMLLDVQDLLQFLHDHGSVSGIQRVQLGILASVMASEAGPLGAGCLTVFPRLVDGSIWAPRSEDMAAVIAFCAGSKLDPQVARRLVAQARERAVRVTPSAGAAFLVLGAFWFFAGAPRFYEGLRRGGLRLGVLIYDMFPATHPEYATADTTRYFNQSLNEGLFFWDFAFAISEYSAAAFRRVAAERGYPPIETVAIPLAHSFGQDGLARPDWLATWPAALGDLEGRDYIVSVSTIEVRKNHLLLFHAWKRMMEEGDNPPPLVLVGRPGWRVADFMGQLEATRNLDGRILVVHGLSDAELEAVYRGCLFTVMPSFVEGWGLSVGESLSFGRACIAASTSALPEVGGDLVAYADPLSVPDWVARLRAWLLDRPALAQAQARIGREFTPRHWPEVARHLLDQAARMAALPPRAVPYSIVPLHIRLGEEIPAGIAVAAVGEDAQASRLALSQAVSLDRGWHPAEAGCTWIQGRVAHFIASTDAPPGSPVEVTVRLNTTPWPNPNQVSLLVEGGAPVRVPLPENAKFSITACGLVDGQGMLRLELRLDHPGREHGDPRRLCLALLHVALRPASAVIAPAEAAPASLDARPATARARPGRSALLAALPGFLSPSRRHLQRANAARDAGDWAGAAHFYGEVLALRPNLGPIRVQHGNMLSMAGEHAQAIAALEAAVDQGAPHAIDMLGNARERARAGATSLAMAQPHLLDLTALLTSGLSPCGWAGLAWATALAGALLRQPPDRVGALLQDHEAGRLRALPQALALELLAAPPEARAALLDGLAARLPLLLPGDHNHILALGLSGRAAGLRLAREAGARVSLLLPEPGLLHAPHLAPSGIVTALDEVLLGPRAACDGLLLAMPAPGLTALLAGIGRHGSPRAGLPWAVLPAPAVLPPEWQLNGGTVPGRPFILADGAPAWLIEAWVCLRAEVPDLPDLLCLRGGTADGPALPVPDEAGLMPLLAGCHMAIATGRDGAFAALALAATAARRACLMPGIAGLDPLDIRATARAIAAMLPAEARAALAMAQATAAPSGPGWDALAEAVLGFGDVPGDAAMALRQPPPPQPLLPALPEQGWALAASQRGGGQRGGGVT